MKILFNVFFEDMFDFFPSENNVIVVFHTLRIQ